MIKEAHILLRCINQLLTRRGTGSHFVTQRPSDPGIQRPGDPVDPVTLFYNELQMSTYVFSGQRIFSHHHRQLSSSVLEG